MHQKLAHKITTTPNGNYYTKIDGKEFLCYDGLLPRTYISELKIQIGSKKLNIPKEYYFNLFNLNLTTPKCEVDFYRKENGELIIVATRSAGAGSYISILIFDNSGQLI